MSTASGHAAPSGSARGEPPTEALQLDEWRRGLAYWLSSVDRLAGEFAEDSAGAREHALRDWQAALPLVRDLEAALVELKRAGDEFDRHKDDPAAASRFARVERRRDDARAEARRLLTETIARGLQRRRGLYMLDEFDEAIYGLLRRFGGDHPPDIAVCEDCSWVFEPTRQYRAKCDRCHKQPRTPTNGFERRDDGGSVAYTHLGASRRHVCEACGAYFNPKRAHARHCSNRCRTASSRGRELPERVERLRVRELGGALAAPIVDALAADDPFPEITGEIARLAAEALAQAWTGTARVPRGTANRPLSPHRKSAEPPIQHETPR